MEEDIEVLLPRGEEYIFGEEAILGDINYINEILKEKLSIEEYNKVITRISIIKADLREKQQLEEENKELREEECCMTTCLRKDKEKVFLENKVIEKIEELKGELTNEITRNDGFSEYREYAIDILEDVLEEE